jgi:anaerobic selenocysteine-containing dehydrogenase
LATVTYGRVTEVKGDPDNPLFKGYTCPKGRALPEMHNSPTRLLQSQKRQTDGSFSPIPIGRAMDEISAKLQAIIEKHGPRSVAVSVAGNRIADVLHAQSNRFAGKADRRLGAW